MGEVKRYDAVHIRYEDHNIRYGEGCEVEMVAAQDYDALRAENAELVAAALSIFEAICMDEMRDSSEGDSPQAAVMRVRRRISTWRDEAAAKHRGDK